MAREDEERELEDLIRREKIGLEAEERWSDTAARIADALEHQVVGQLLMQLAALGRQVPVHNIKHRADCPACKLTRMMIEEIRNQSGKQIITAKPNGTLAS
jgi:hypothetical protein